MADEVAPAATVLVVTAHPDDVDFGSGGSVARWVAEGSEVHYCVITDGDAGGFDPAIPRAEIPAIRRAEQRAAADALGVASVTFLGYSDGRLEMSMDLRRDVSRVIRQVRPDRLVCQSPERNYDRIGASHPDHMVAGDAALAAFYPDARNPFAHPELAEEGLEAHVTAEAWVQGGPQANVYVDITDYLDQKVKALLCHESQITAPDQIPDLVRRWSTAVAQAGGLPEGRLAESYRRVSG